VAPPGRPADHDGVVVSVTGINGDVGDIDLTAGLVYCHLPKHAAQTTMTHEQLQRVRESVLTLHAQGDREVRLSQFVLGEVRFVMCIDGVVVTHVYMDEGGRMGDPMDLILAAAYARLPSA
jgi:hypothetical protein